MGTYFTDLANGQLADENSFNAPLTALDTQIAIINNKLTGVTAFSPLFNGNVQANGIITSNGAAADTRAVYFSTGNVDRWRFQVTGAEGGGNAGSTFYITALSDAGGFLRHALTVQRTGEMIFSATAMSFFDVPTAVAKPTITGATDSTKITSIISALSTLGLAADGT